MVRAGFERKTRAHGRAFDRVERELIARGDRSAGIFGQDVGASNRRHEIVVALVILERERREGRDQLADGLVAIVRVLRERLEEHVREGVGQIRAERARIRHRVGGDRSDARRG